MAGKFCVSFDGHKIQVSNFLKLISGWEPRCLELKHNKDFLLVNEIRHEKCALEEGALLNENASIL